MCKKTWVCFVRTFREDGLKGICMYIIDFVFLYAEQAREAQKYSMLLFITSSSVIFAS